MESAHEKYYLGDCQQLVLTKKHDNILALVYACMFVYIMSQRSIVILSFNASSASLTENIDPHIKWYISTVTNFIWKRGESLNESVNSVVTE